MGDTVKVRVPGTTANCGPGFDVMGIACNLYNELELKLLPERVLNIEIHGDGANKIALDERNLVWKTIERLLKEVDSNYQGAEIVMHNNIPLSRGLGSSSAAIVAGLYAANLYLGEPLDKQGLFELADEIEGHPDNVAPALFGGITVSLHNEQGLKHISFPSKLPLKLVVAIPDFQLSTKKARSVLKPTVPFTDAIFNISHVAMLVAALAQGDVNALKGVFDDKLVQPYRAELIPGMYDVFETANKLGALGTTISGAGPTLIAYTLENADAIGKNMVKTFAKHDISARYLVLDIDTQGVIAL